MAEFLSPGLFIEEVPASAQVVQAVSTSNVGIVGYTQRGPTNVATLVTSQDQFTRTFGGFVSQAPFTPLAATAFFSNDGRRAFVVRVIPSDAVASDAYVLSQRSNYRTNVGDGTTATVTQLVLTPALLTTPLAPGSLTFRWRSAGTPVVAQQLRKRDGTTLLVGDTTSTKFDARILPSALPTFDSKLHSVNGGGTLTLGWTDSGGADTLTLTATGNGTATGTGGTGTTSTATLDLFTGRISISFAAADTPTATAITLSYTPTSATKTVTDNGSGVLPAGSVLTGAGSINYTTGVYTFTAVAAPHSGGPILADYQVRAWNLDPISAGTWGNGLRLNIGGSADAFDAPTATFSKFNVSVLLFNSSTSSYDTIESYEDIDFSDPLAANYFADVLNELSDLVRVTVPAGSNEAPGALAGLSQTLVLSAGDAVTGSKSHTGTLSNAPIASRTLTISYTDSTAVARTITDDGAGNLIGAVDPAGTNTINYTTGAFSFTTSQLVGGNTFVSATYRSAAAEVTDSTTLSGGTDGTFASPNWGRDQVTNPALQADYQGIYALDRVEELMQVIVPDFAGDSSGVITKDIINYVEGRASLPAGGDRFAILTVPLGSSPQEAVDYFRYTIGQYSKFSAFYWPWVRVADPLANGRPLSIPAIGHVAGVYARTDVNRNVGKAPGGTVDGVLRFLLSLERDSTQGERDFVYPNRINPLINSPQTGLAVWGVRTAAIESEWRYINARRLFMFLEKSIFNSTHWIVFENNGPALWVRIKTQINGFLIGLFNEGYFAGTTPAEAFKVVCDETNNSSASIDAGQVIIDVAVAPNRPAEFVRFRLSQKSLDA